MLAINFIPLLLGLAPLASASPFTLPANPNLRPVTFTTTDNQAMGLTTTSPTGTTTTDSTSLEASSSPEDEEPRRTQQPELRDVPAPARAQQRDGFATSPATASSTAAATTAAATEAEATKTRDQAATTTPAPTDDPGVDSDLAREGYSQLTFYSCEKYAATVTHCGWHEEVVHVGGTDGRGRQAMGGAPGLAAAGVAACAMVVNRALR